MEYRIARFLSYLFHPLLMPTLGIFLFFQLGTYHRYAIPQQAIWFIHITVFLNTFVIPSILTFVMYRRKMIPSLHLENRKDRLLPFFLAFLFFTFNYISLRRTNLPWPVYSLMLGSALAVFFALIINLRWKISIHMIGMGGVVGGLYAVSQIFFPEAGLVLLFMFLTILASGMVGFARLKLHAHQPAQVYAGFLLGFVCEFVPVYWHLG